MWLSACSRSGCSRSDGVKVRGVIVFYTDRCTLCTRMLCTAPGQVCADCKAMMHVSFRRERITFRGALAVAGRIAFCLLGLTFLSWWIIVPIMGGTALSGCIEHGHYYIGFKDGCRERTEVSHAVFEYSRWHGLLMISIWVMVLLCYLLRPMIPLIRVVGRWRSRRWLSRLSR
jgi:hypothetical protein